MACKLSSTHLISFQVLALKSVVNSKLLSPPLNKILLKIQTILLHFFSLQRKYRRTLLADTGLDGCLFVRHVWHPTTLPAMLFKRHLGGINAAIVYTHLAT